MSIIYICSSVAEPINTGIDSIYSISLLNGNMAVISGSEAGLRMVKSFNLQTATPLNSLNLTNAYGLAEVKLGGKTALAVSYRLVKDS